MSSDEVMAFMAALALGTWAWIAFLKPALTVRRGRSGSTGRVAAVLTIGACGLALYSILKAWSADDVRNDPVYMFFYTFIGMAWLGVGSHLLGLFGVSARDDAIERDNAAALIAIAGGQLGITLAFAGANIGNGPGWWVVIFCAAMSTGALFALWFVLNILARVADVIVIDRDAAAGLRAAGFFVATGIVFGRAAAGDWVSAEAAVIDFLRVGGPALLLIPLAAAVERISQPTPLRPRSPVLAMGLMPACIYVGLALVYVRGVGPW